MNRILLESQLKEKPIAYTKWKKMFKEGQNVNFDMFKTNIIFHF